jgi:methyl-accepting chemotaxis protein
MVGKLREVVSEVSTACYDVSQHSGMLTHSARNTEQDIDQQLQRVTEISTAAQQMTATSEHLAATTAEISQYAQETFDMATNGSSVVRQSVSEVNAISVDIQSLSEMVLSLKSQSENINEIVSVIMSIAEQTNLLALNAAIEAARAGDHGRGFAVVADEVRNLANRTTGSTQEISGVIESINSVIGQVIQAMENSRERVMHGAALSGQAGEALDQILQRIESLQGNLQQIASSTEELSNVSRETSENLVAINQIVDGVTGSVKQVTGASNGLENLANHLEKKIGFFRT